MKKKVNIMSYWIWWSLAIIAVFWIILVHQMRMSHLIMIPVILVYLGLNALIFKPYVLGMLGTYYLYRGQRERAYQLLEKAVNKNTENINALFHWAIKLLEEGNGKDALVYLEKARKLNTMVMMNKNILLAMGSCYWVMGEIDQAIETLNSLMEKYEYVNPSVLTTIGYLYFLKGDNEKAEELTQKALKDNSEHSAAWDNMGQIYYSKGDNEKAKEYFTKALEFKSTMVDSLFYMGKIAENENNNELAKEYFEKASKCNVTALNTVKKEEIEEMLEKYK